MLYCFWRQLWHRQTKHYDIDIEGLPQRERERKKIFPQIKINVIPECPLLSNKMHIQLGSLVQKQEVRGVQKSEVEVTSAFETNEENQNYTKQKWKYKLYQSLVKWYNIISLVTDTISFH